MKDWRQRNRTDIYEEINVPIHKLPPALRPPLLLVADSELRKIRNQEAKTELARREQVRKEHVEANRAMYVFRTEGFQDRMIWWVHRAPERRVSKKRGHGYDEGRSAETRSQGIGIAQMILIHNDEGGVIYAEPGGFSHEKEAAVIDVRPSTCEYLAEHGKHDWFYVPTGDDVCRSCGLVT